MTELEPSEMLSVPKRRRFVQNRVQSPDGREELHVFYGDREIVFDEPELLPFADQLLARDSFRAEEAMTWSNAEPHSWEKIRELLTALLEHDVLKRAADAPSTAGPKRTFPATFGPPEERVPRTFGSGREACEALTREALGRAFDPSNLEVVLPVYRVAHPALDRDGRQVGENNVTPRCAFLDLPTQRRECHYAGSRYQVDVPMNVTALKHMTSRWPELLSLTEQFRAAFLARLPARGTSLRAGELHVLSVCCLGAVGYVLVRGEAPLENGQLDGGLAAMFRLIDGVRLVTTELMRQRPAEHTCELGVNARGIADHAERNGLYHGIHGVCAGPQALIDEYLRVLCGEARAPVEAEPSLASRLGDLEAALDYGLRAQRVEAIVRSFGSRQGLAYERWRAAFDTQAPLSGLAERLAAPVDPARHPLLRTDYPLPEQLQLELSISRWMFAYAARGLSGAEPAGASIDAVLELDPAAQARDRQRLAAFLARLPELEPLPPPLRDELARTAAEVFALERRCLHAVAEEQRQLNERLRRPAGRPLMGEDLAVYTQPRSGPPLARVLGEALGVSIDSDAQASVLRRGDLVVSLVG